MALLSPSSSCSYPISFLQFHKQSVPSKPLISKTLLLTTIFPNISTISISISSNISFSSRQRLRCCTSSSFSTERDDSPSTRIFINGLPQSTCEGSLKKAFSQFGEVSRATPVAESDIYVSGMDSVKIIREKKSWQSLGFAYIWFTREESAQLAVKEMDGKFLDGRFVFVTIAKPGSSENRVKATPYKF